MRALISATVLALALTACGGGDDDKGSSGATEASLRETAGEFFLAFFEPDADKAYSMLSKRCKDAESKDDFETVLNQAAELYGQVKVKIKSVKVDGNEGTIDGETGIPALDEDDGNDDPQWVFEDGSWRSDSCG